MRQISIYTDYVCPYCLLAESVVQRAIQDEEVEIRWRPFELRPEPVTTLKPEDSYLPRVWQQSVYPMAEKLGVPIKLPSISPQPRTDKAFEVFAMADANGLGHEFSVRALKAFFQEDKDIGNAEVLAQLGADVGLKRDEVLGALENGTYRESHAKAQKHAREKMGIKSVPTIVIGKKIFTGVPSVGEIRVAIKHLVSDSASQV